MCEQTVAEPQFDFVSAAFDAMDVSERSQLESAMARPTGTLVWLQLQGQWLLTRLTGNWTAAEATMLQVKGQAVQPATLQLLSSRGASMSEATTVKLLMTQAIWLPASHS